MLLKELDLTEKTLKWPETSGPYRKKGPRNAIAATHSLAPRHSKYYSAIAVNATIVANL